jgi:hypothetical protein
MAGMRGNSRNPSIFNVQIMGATDPSAYIWVGAMVGGPLQERRTMMTGKNVVAALRRDASYVLSATIAVVFIGFAGLALAAALFDLLPIRH